jgi:predicted phosphatase
VEKLRNNPRESILYIVIVIVIYIDTHTHHIGNIKIIFGHVSFKNIICETRYSKLILYFLNLLKNIY